MINIVGVEFLINFGGLGQLINELAERYDLPGTYARDLLRRAGQRRVLRRRPSASSAGCGRDLRERRTTARRRRDGAHRRVRARRHRRDAARRRGRRCRASGWLFRDVVPSLAAIGTRDRARCSASASSTPTSATTAGEIGVGAADRRRRGLAVGIALGANRFLSRAYEALRLLPRPDAEDHLLPGDDHVVRRGRRLEDRDGRAVVLLPDRDQRRRRHARDRPRADPRRPELPRHAVADGDARSTCRRCAQPIVNGVRLGLGVAIIGTLLAETKLSNRGIGYLIIQAYSTFDMPRMYALLIVLFVLAIGSTR